MSYSFALAGLCVAYLAWVLAGYPLWLWFTARRGRPTAALMPDYEPGITAILPVYNGAKFLVDKLDSILASHYPQDKLEVLVLSDGSSDDTDRLTQEYAAKAGGRVRFERLPRGGKSAALNRGLELTDREILLMTDVRQQLEPDCVPRLVARMADPQVGVCSGNLKILTARNSEEANVGLYWRYEKWIRGNLSRRDSLVGATGGIYLMRRSLTRPLPPDCLLDDVWLPMQAVLAGYRAVFETSAAVWDVPTALATEFNRKVRTQAGIYQLLWQEPRLLGPSNRLFPEFLFLKLGRLFLPHALLLLLLSGFLMPWPWSLFAVTAQMGFYALALLDPMLAEKSLLKRATAPVRAFLTLLLAAFCAQAIFFIPAGQLWRVTVAVPSVKRP